VLVVWLQLKLVAVAAVKAASGLVVAAVKATGSLVVAAVKATGSLVVVKTSGVLAVVEAAGGCGFGQSCW
jgi:hypothetical protein